MNFILIKITIRRFFELMITCVLISAFITFLNIVDLLTTKSSLTRKGYIICGDNRTNLERDITDNDIIGVLTAFYHNGKFVKCTDEAYIRYSIKVCRSLPVRIVKNTIKRILKKIYKILKPWKSNRSEKRTIRKF